MKKKRIIPINYINLTVVLVVTLFIAIVTQNIISELTIRDIKNVTRLTYTNIYAEINQELAEPVNTSVIMAQNTLLFDFMDQDTPQTEAKMAEYLSAIQNVTGYESVFVVPDSTLSYYHPGGTDAKVDVESDEAYWYTVRMDATDRYGLVVNTEQLDNLALTIYVDANMNDINGNFAGVAGVGKRIIHLQDILTSYLDNQGVEAYIINDEGLVMVHQDNDIIKNTSFYDLENIESQAVDVQQSQTKSIEKMIDNRFFIIRYIPMIDWYLVVKKSTSDLTGTLSQYSHQIMTALGLGALVILLVTNYAISMYKNQIINLSNIDHLTDIPNRTIFDSALREALKTTYNRSFSLAIFDLDNLKQINDSLGHDMGDYTLKLISELARDIFQKPDFVSRVGGDEFAVILYKPIHEAQVMLEDFQSRIKANINLQKIGATVSVGITESQVSDSETDIYKRADEALYRSKNTGKDMIHIS